MSGTFTDLKNSSYNFTESAGLVSNRFEIVFQTQVLATAEALLENVEIYRSGEHFVVKSKDILTKVVVYDASGRLILKMNPKSNEANFEVSQKGLYHVKIVAGENEIVKKILK